MTEPASSYYYPNKMGQILLRGMEETLGQNGINAVLNQSKHSHLINNYPPNNLEREFQYSDISQIYAALEEIYGKRGGQGLAIRSGRACFKYGLREFAPMVNTDDIEFRLLPLHAKIREGAGRFADTFNKYSDQRVRVDEMDEYFLWHIERCPICWERYTETPMCHLATGTLQEALYWVSGGKYFNVEEIMCVAKGDPTCTFQIDKRPME